MKIIISTSETSNTTPFRGWDYIASIEGREEEQIYSEYGSTPEEAILNLMESIVGIGAL